MEENTNQQEPKEQPQQASPAPVAASEPKANNVDVEKNKVMAIVGYILPFLFFVPLLSEETKKSPFAKFHANQQLNFFLAGIVGWIAISIVSVIFAVTLILIPLIFLLWAAYQIAILVFLILGVINAAKGEMKKLPIIGGFEIIK